MKASFSYASPIDWIPFHLFPWFSLPLFLCLSFYDRREGWLGQCKSRTTQNTRERERERERDRFCLDATPVYLKGKFAPRDCSYRWLIDPGFFQLLPGLFSAKGSRCSRVKSRRMSAVQGVGRCSRDLGLFERWICSLGSVVSVIYWFSFFLLLARVPRRIFKLVQLF